MTGSSHEKKGSVCQDANKIISLYDGKLIIAAVADGVGSCKYSDVASKIAVDIATKYCQIMITKNRKNLKNFDFVKVIEEAFIQAELHIEKKSLQDDQPISEYDTTLDLVIYYGGSYVFYGHCGDGGIIGLTDKGDYIKITTVQKKDGIYVIPLRSGSKDKNNTWVFGSTKYIFASVLLATDGVYDLFFPYLLKGQPVEIYIPLIQYFMDNNGLNVSEKTIDEITRNRMDFLNSKECEHVTDDKTMVVLINEKVKPKRKDANYYAEPDWEKLQLEWNKKAYPHLHKEIKDDNPEQENNTKNENNKPLVKFITDADIIKIIPEKYKIL